MDWLEHALRESPYTCGAIAGVVTFVFLGVVRTRPERIATNLAVGLGFGMLAAFEVMRLWPPTLIQSEILAGTLLGGFLLGLMLSRLGSITFDTAVHEFVIEQSVLKNALTALFMGVFVAVLPFYADNSGGADAVVVVCAWTAGAMFGHWRRVVRAGGA